MQGRFADNPAYVEYEALLTAVHALDAQGKGESDKADAARERMCDLELKLNRPEKDRLSGLSADLYMLQDAEVLEPGVAPPDNFDGLMKEAYEWNAWASVLDLLRRRPPIIFPHIVAIARARAYDGLGHPRTALLFLDYAYRANPTDPTYLGLRMMFLCRAGMLAEAAAEAERFVADRAADPLLVIASADVLCQQAFSGTCAELASQTSRHVLGVIDRVIGAAPASAKLPPSYLVIANLVRALCHSQLGERDQSLADIDAAIQADPGDAVLRHLREEAKRESNQAASARAVRHTLDHVRDLARRTIPTRLAA